MPTEPVFGRSTKTGWNAHRPIVTAEEKRAAAAAVANLPKAKMTPEERERITKMLRGTT